MNRNYVNALDRLTEAYETIDFHGKKPSAAWLVRAAQAHALLAIHDLLADRLPEPPESWATPEYTCPGCPDSAQNAAQEALGGDSGTQGPQGGSGAHSGDSDIRPEPESVTLPRGVVDVAWARLEVAASDPAANQEYATRHRAAADALLAALAAASATQKSDQGGRVAQDAGGAKGGCECRYVGGMEEVAVCGQCLGRSQS